MYLFQEFFYEKNPERFEEYIFCIKKNANLSFVEQIFLLINSDEYQRHKDIIDNVIKYIDSDKVRLVEHNDPYYNERITFNTILLNIIPEFAKIGLIKKDSVIGLSNLDIFLEDSDYWKHVDRDFFRATDNKACLALARMEYVNEDFKFKNQEAWKTGEFCDAWFLKLPIALDEYDFIINENIHPSIIPLGNAPGCDNVMFGVLSKKYKVFNWADRYVIYHLDVVRKPSVKDGTPADMIINEKCVDLKLNHVYTHLSPYSNDWERVLSKFKDNSISNEIDDALDVIKENWKHITNEEETYILNLSEKLKML